MKNKLLAVFHFLLVILLIAWNYLTNTGKVHQATVGEISAKYYNLFTPASYAFSIWGLIFLGLLSMSVFLLQQAFTNKLNRSISQALPAVLVGYLGIMAWLWFWLKQETLISVGIMLLILISFISARLQMDRGLVHLSKKENWLLVKPIELTAAWISVALAANISAHLKAIEWDGWQLKEESWVILLIATLLLVNYFVLKKRQYILFPIVTIWTLIAIAVKHAPNYRILFYIPLLASIGLVLILVQQIRAKVNFR